MADFSWKQFIDPGALWFDEGDPQDPDWRRTGGALGKWAEGQQDVYTSQMDAEAQAAMAREAMQMQAAKTQAAQIAMGPQGQMRGEQVGMLGQIGARARGEMPSQAEIAFGRAQESNIAAAASAAASTRGMNAATQARMRQQGMERANVGAAAEMAGLRAGEQAMAEQTFLQGAGGIRGTDIGLATQQAGFQQEAGLAGAGFQQEASMTNLAAQQRQQEINQQRAQFLQEQGYARDIEQQRLAQEAKIAQQEAQSQQAIAESESAAETARQGRQQKAEKEGGVTSAAGAIVGGLIPSDVRVKGGVRTVNKVKMQEFLDSIKAKDYEYKPEFVKAEAGGDFEEQIAPGKEYQMGFDEKGGWVSPSWGTKALEKMRVGEREDPSVIMQSYDRWDTQTEQTPWWQKAPPQDVYAGTEEERPLPPPRPPQDVYAGTEEEGRGFGSRTFAPSGSPSDYARIMAARKQQLAGPKTGVTAQDLERSEIGRRMVSEDESGIKRIKPDQSTMMASLGHLNERLSNIEAREKRLAKKESRVQDRPEGRMKEKRLTKIEKRKEKLAKRKQRFLEEMKKGAQ